MLFAGGFPLLAHRVEGIHYVLRSPAAPDGTQLEHGSEEELFDLELKEDAKQYITCVHDQGGLGPSLFINEVPSEVFFDIEIDRRIGEMAHITAASPTVSKHNNCMCKVVVHHLFSLHVLRLHSLYGSRSFVLIEGMVCTCFTACSTCVDAFDAGMAVRE